MDFPSNTEDISSSVRQEQDLFKDLQLTFNRIHLTRFNLTDFFFLVNASFLGLPETHSGQISVWSILKPHW